VNTASAGAEPPARPAPGRIVVPGRDQGGEASSPKDAGSGLAGRLDGFQRRHPAAGFPLAVLYKYFDDSGGYLAALIAYYGFVSLFPLLLLSTVLGFLLSGDPHLQHQILNSALSQFPVVGSQLSDPKGLGGGTPGLIVGILGSLYGGLGVAQAV
jgi:membrane protein